MATGTVKSVTDKGYGFIKTPESKDKDVFYHESNLKGELATRKLRVGDEVEFTIERNEKGLNAVDIKLAGSEDSANDEVSAETEDQMEETEETSAEPKDEMEETEEEVME